MENPKKIIFKFKNKNRRIQYNCYIFLGSLVDNKTKSILEKIKDLSLFDSLLKLSKKDVKILEEKYTIYWYKYFFNFYHLEFEFKKILSTDNKKKQIKKRLGRDWFNKHIKINKLILPKLRHSYSYKTSKNLIYNIMVNKKRQKNFLLGEDKSIYDYRINELVQKGGDKEEDSEGFDLDNLHQMNMDKINESEEISDEDLSNEEESNEEESNEEESDDEESDEDESEVIQGEVKADEKIETDEFDDGINLEDLESEFMQSQVDESLASTSKLISKAIEQGKMKKVKDTTNKFPDEKNNSMYDENIKNNFKKIYIYTSYIFDDDSILKIKKKISISILNNPIFVGTFKHDNYIVPSRIYLYGKHKYKDRFNSAIMEESIMIGQKWIRKNELLKIDVEPSDNLKNYEELRDNLKYLASNILKSSSKIRRENNNSNLFNHYKEYVQNNDIYMIDIYNDLGENYGQSSDNKQIKNLFDTYVRIYFPEIIFDNFKKLVDYLNTSNDDQLRKDEITFIREVHETNRNDLFLESQITSTIEDLKTKRQLYDKIIKYNYITQAVTHVLLDEKNMSNVNRKKLDLFRIFDNFVVSEEYPFIQWQTVDGSIFFKYYKKSSEKDKDTILSKWIQHTPYGISFKVKTNIKDLSANLQEFKYISINLNENGRLEYKTQYKEDNKATMDDIYDTYNIVNTLLKKINLENKSIKFLYPKNEDFKFAFINSIIKFELPKKAVINHNELSELCRYFYPYIVLVIEPRKREAKIKKDDSKSKYGTYLRYKRINKYDTEQRIELKIIYFLKNYEFNINSLAIELSKQYNITEKEALEKINEVKSKFNVRRVRKVLKKLNEIPKLKTPGIEIEIQGKTADNYKIRISGARNKDQLDKIIKFLEILIFLYYDTYINKSSKRVKLLETLKVLHNIAKRRNKVLEPKIREDETKKVKQLIKGDKDRLGFKPQQGQDHYSRACQNSGKKKRQPQGIELDKLKNKGFKLNDDSGFYEKEVNIKVGKSKKLITIRAIKQKSSTTGKDIYYFCDPEKGSESNGEYMHIGFLTRAINPNGLCMPCCFKKDQFMKEKSQQRDFFLKCLGKEEEIILRSTKLYGDKLYILQDTNKIQEGRYGMLPKFLDIMLNKNFNRKLKIENHYLIEAPSGYLFKYGVDVREDQFINCMRAIFNLSKTEFLEKIITSIKKNDNIFTFLNSGDIKTQFINKENFFQFLTSALIINEKLLRDIFLVPGVFDEYGYNLIIFEKKFYKDINTEKILSKFIIKCNNNLSIENDNKYIFILKENKFYYPIFEVTKDNVSNKFNIYKTFKKDIEFVLVFSKYLAVNCKNNMQNLNQYSAKKIITHLEKNKINILGQIIDKRNKCIFILTKYLLIPCTSSGSDFNYKILEKNEKQILSIDKTVLKLKELQKKLKDNNFLKFNGFSSAKQMKDNYLINGILLENGLIIPVKNKNIKYNKLKKISNKFKLNAFTIENVAFDKEINDAINSDNIISDPRMKEITLKNFNMENYNLFKLEFSTILSNDRKIVDEIMNVLKKKNKKEKVKELKNIFYKKLDRKLFKFLKQKGGDFVFTKKIDIPNKYIVNNTRELCNIHKKNECNKNNNCIWKGNNCNFKLTYENAVKYINKLIEEILDSDYKANELLQKDEYFISDIVDYNSFTPRNNQAIIRSNSMNANIVLSEIFGENSIPQIGKKNVLRNKISIEENQENPYEQIGDFIYQKIKKNHIIFRVLANSFYWLKNPTFSIEDRNLGYTNPIQTSIANFIRGEFITWLSNVKNWNFIKNNMKYINIDKGIMGLDQYINKISNKNYKSNFKTELLLFNIIFKITIYIMNNSNKIIYMIKNGSFKKIGAKIDIINKDCIFIKYESNDVNDKFTDIFSVYKVNL